MVSVQFIIAAPLCFLLVVALLQASSWKLERGGGGVRDNGNRHRQDDGPEELRWQEDATSPSAKSNNDDDQLANISGQQPGAAATPLRSYEFSSPSSHLEEEHSASLEEEAAEQAVIICQPRHIHLSVGSTQNSTHTSMIISFSFLPECIEIFQYHHSEEVDEDMTSAVIVGAVRLGRSTQDISQLVLGDIEDVQSYNVSLTKWLMRHSKTGKAGHTHYLSDDYYHIEVDGLEAGMRYFYECLLVQHDHEYQYQSRGNYGIISQSSYSTFLAPPGHGQWYPPSLGRSSIKFAVIGDLGNLPHSVETVKNLEQMNHQRHLYDGVGDNGGSDNGSSNSSPEQRFHKQHSQNIDAILLAGDLSYANNDHDAWDDWFDMMSNHTFFSTIPVQIALGNHDIDHVETDEIAVAYEKRFRMPRVRAAIKESVENELFTEKSKYLQAKDFMPYEWGNAYYSYTFGPTKHIVLSSYSSFRPGSIQYKWLVSELESVDRSVTPWLIVMLHCPPYTTFRAHSHEIYLVEARLHLEPLFAKYTVNFVLSGHIHSYMRTVPTIDSKPHPKGPIYIIQGNGGRQVNEPYLNKTVAEEWVKVRDHATYGYGALELYNATTARWKWVKTGFNEEGEGGIRGDFTPDFELTDDVWVTNQLFVEEE